MGSEEYRLLPGGGVEDCEEGVLWEKNEPWPEPDVSGRFRGGGSRGSWDEEVGMSPEDGPRGRPGLKGGI
jgi:hypothetical protein